jgi:hypothetical protein
VTDQEKQQILQASRQVAVMSHDEGMLTAVEMIRMAAHEKPGATLLEVADAIEATVKRTPRD